MLDTALLESAAGLTISGTSDEVIVPGNISTDSVAFGINSPSATAPLLPTTFSYDSDDFLTTFSGTIEHLGSVFFNTDTVEVGNFTIGFDGARASATTSGFFVESTVGISAILFDVAPPTALSATATDLTIAADLLVSPDFAGFLNDTGLTGVDVGDALVEGGSPGPIPRCRCRPRWPCLRWASSASATSSGVLSGLLEPGSMALPLRGHCLTGG